MNLIAWNQPQAMMPVISMLKLYNNSNMLLPKLAMYLCSYLTYKVIVGEKHHLSSWLNLIILVHYQNRSFLHVLNQSKWSHELVDITLKYVWLIRNEMSVVLSNLMLKCDTSEWVPAICLGIP